MWAFSPTTAEWRCAIFPEAEIRCEIMRRGRLWGHFTQISETSRRRVHSSGVLRFPNDWYLADAIGGEAWIRCARNDFGFDGIGWIILDVDRAGKMGRRLVPLGWDLLLLSPGRNKDTAGEGTT